MSDAAEVTARPAARAQPWPRRGAAAVVALLWAALIFWESSRANPFPFLPSSLLSHDKLLHFGAYGVLAGSLRVALASSRHGRRWAFLVAIALAAGYGATDEWHQLYVPGRQCDGYDWIADATGALAGAVAAGAFLRRRGGAG